MKSFVVCFVVFSLYFSAFAQDNGATSIASPNSNPAGAGNESKTPTTPQSNKPGPNVNPNSDPKNTTDNGHLPPKSENTTPAKINTTAPTNSSTANGTGPNITVPTTHATPTTTIITTTTPSNIATTPNATIVPTNKTDTSNDAHPKTSEPVQTRGFDGGSFVGGIILTLGLLAIGFIGFKYYKKQQRNNYNNF